VKAAGAVGLVVLLLAGSSSAEEKAAKQLLRSGVDRYRAFDYEGAADDLRRGLNASLPGDEKGTSAILRALGDALVVLGRDAEAAAAYRRLLDIETRRHAPTDPALNATRWALYAMETALGRHEEAGRLFRDVVDASRRSCSWTPPTSTKSPCSAAFP
jgi:tetratricopeptide (TPR) repeat protein